MLIHTISTNPHNNIISPNQTTPYLTLEELHSIELHPEVPLPKSTSSHRRRKDAYGDLIPVAEGDPRFSMMRPSVLLNRVYLGSFNDGTRWAQLSKSGITHVLNLHSSSRTPPPGSDLQVLHMPMSDYGEDDIRVVFKKVKPFLLEGCADKNRLMIHCRSGVNRSATIAIMCLMLTQKYSLKDAFVHVKERRPQISPHEVYFEQLQSTCL